jgi:hypothetical protein
VLELGRDDQRLCWFVCVCHVEFKMGGQTHTEGLAGKERKYLPTSLTPHQDTTRSVLS